MEKIRVAVVVENHEYDVMAFQKMLDSFAGCECYVQPLDLFARDAKNQDAYDTVLWYNMNLSIPEEGAPLRNYVENKLGAGGQGIVLVHHALLCFGGWDVFTDVVGVSSRCTDGSFSYHMNMPVRCVIQGGGHPVTQGLRDFDLVDETYVMGEPDQPGNDILITAECEMGIKNIGWAREYKASRVFATASGHDDRAYADANYRKLLLNAIRWTSRRV